MKLFSALPLIFSASLSFAGDLPDAQLTPGAINPDVTQDNIQDTVCIKGWTKTIRPHANYTNKLKKIQIRQYEYENTNPKDYEEDHLIALSIGGHPTARENLWPQPRKSEWNAAKKDQLEFVLYKKVCAGDVSLKDAQDAMATDWVHAWKKYVSGNNMKFRSVD